MYVPPPVVYVPPTVVNVAPVRQPIIQRTYIGQPPSVDPYLLKDFSHGGHSFDNGNGFRSAMNELERLEQDEDIRIRGILDGLRGLGMG